jgi:lysophospholipase L1-like esterase
LLQEKLNIPIINSGICGDTTAGMLARLDRDVLAYKPSHVIIMGGTNDIWHGLSHQIILSHIMAMTRQARHRNIKAIIGIPPPCLSIDEDEGHDIFLDSTALSRAVDRFRAYLIQAAKEDETSFIDFGKHMEQKHFLDDGVHVNEAGQHVMAENALKLITSLG